MALIPQNKKLSAIQIIIRFAIVIGWVLAPMILNDVLYKRNAPLPEDIRVIVAIVWYGAGLWLGNMYAELIKERTRREYNEKIYRKRLGED